MSHLDLLALILVSLCKCGLVQARSVNPDTTIPVALLPHPGNDLNPLEVTLDVYSGIRNPTWTVYPGDNLHGTLFSLLQQYESTPLQSVLGYRGFEVHGGNANSQTVAAGSSQELESILLRTGLRSNDPTTVEIVQELLCKETGADTFCKALPTTTSSISSESPSPTSSISRIPAGETIGFESNPFLPTNIGLTLPTATGVSSPTQTGVTSTLTTGYSSPTTTGYVSPSTTDFASPKTTGYSLPTSTDSSSPTPTSYSSTTTTSPTSPTATDFPSPTTTNSSSHTTYSSSSSTTVFSSSESSSQTPSPTSFSSVTTGSSSSLPTSSSTTTGFSSSISSSQPPISSSSTTTESSSSTPTGPSATSTYSTTKQTSSSQTTRTIFSQTTSSTTTVTPSTTPKPCTGNCPNSKPGKWNNPNDKANNNCYNYATNSKTGTFAQPGRGSGKTYTSMTGPAVKAAAERDGLKVVASPAAVKNGECLVALVVWPGIDFHWYRRDRNGKWSHKPGSTAATNKDNSGNVITDPRTADTGKYKFVTFMSYCPGKITVKK